MGAFLSAEAFFISLLHIFKKKKQHFIALLKIPSRKPSKEHSGIPGSSSGCFAVLTTFCVSTLVSDGCVCVENGNQAYGSVPGPTETLSPRDLQQIHPH